MAQTIESRHVDTLVVGGGSAGLAAAIAAEKNGADTLLVEAGPSVGGELLSGLPVLGCHNARGDWIVGGIIEELLSGCKSLNGYAGAACDYRLTSAVCVDPSVMKIVVQELLAKYGVSVLLYTFAVDVVTNGNKVEGIVCYNKSGRVLITADVIIDCSGDGDLAVKAGANYEKGSSTDELQPISLIFQMGNVNFESYLAFLRDNPNEFLLAENPVYPSSKEDCAKEVYKAGPPFFTGLSAQGQLLRDAIESEEMFPTTAIYASTTNLDSEEVVLNTTRVTDIDATDPQQLSDALATLTDQVEQCTDFLRQEVPGFENAHLSRVSPRIGIRETRRVVGEYVLTREDVIDGKKSDTAIAKGAHHVDIHGKGTEQERIPVKDGGSYDIPFECLIPETIDNMFVAGRCLSADREAFGSVRVMGQCLATGQAAGTAAALYSHHDRDDTRSISIKQLQETLSEQGAIL